MLQLHFHLLFILKNFGTGVGYKVKFCIYVSLNTFLTKHKQYDTCCDLDSFLQMMYLTNYCCFVCSWCNWSSNSSTPATACSTVRSLSRCLAWYGFSSFPCTRTGKILPSRSLTKNLLELRDDVILAGPTHGCDTVFLVVVKAPHWGCES